jgi:hypothetical protein
MDQGTMKGSKVQRCNGAKVQRCNGEKAGKSKGESDKLIAGLYV